MNPSKLVSRRMNNIHLFILLSDVHHFSTAERNFDR